MRTKLLRPPYSQATTFTKVRWMEQRQQERIGRVLTLEYPEASDAPVSDGDA